MATASLINLLPPEILSHIFEALYYDENNTIHVPIELGGICKLWRSITLATPGLWANIRITHWPMSEPRTFSKHLPVIHTLLERSGNLSCTLTMAISNLEETPLLSSILRPIADRIRDLNIWVPLQELIDAVDIFNHGLPRLERLVVAFVNGYKRGGGLINTPCRVRLSLQSCPRLAYLDLAEEVFTFIKRKDVLAMLPAHLKHLELQEAFLSTTVRILLKCPDLEVLDLQMMAWLDIGDPFPLSIPALPFSHNSLRVLDLDYLGEHIGMLFQNVAFPSLTQLKLRQTSLGAPHDILEAIVSRIVPPLERLELDHLSSSVTASKLVQFLKHVPTIRKLIINECQCFNKFLVQALTLSPDRPSQILPHLQHLEVIDYTPGLLVNSAVVFRMVESRWRVRVIGCERLGFVKIYDDRVISDEFVGQFRKMEAEGLYIDLVGFIPSKKEEECA
ncbi:hypothetical protein AX16_006262 [Volvariella volvacea WC 439]|nr:hypothetical protein AX16_006262 [Volvariella volvacea WC 439]